MSQSLSFSLSSSTTHRAAAAATNRIRSIWLTPPHLFTPSLLSPLSSLSSVHRPCGSSSSSIRCYSIARTSSSIARGVHQRNGGVHIPNKGISSPFILLSTLPASTSTSSSRSFSSTNDPHPTSTPSTPSSSSSSSSSSSPSSSEGEPVIVADDEALLSLPNKPQIPGSNPIIETATEASPTATTTVSGGGGVPGADLSLLPHRGELLEHGLANSFWPPDWIMQALEDVHVWTGLPWWGSIIVTTVVVKLLLLPSSIYALQNTHRLRNVNPEIKMLSEQMQEYKKVGDVEQMKATQMKMFNMLKEHNVKMLPVGNMIPQMIMLMSFFFGLRKMCTLPLPSFQTGGTAWFTDLTIADPYYILPISGTLMLATTMLIAIRDSQKQGSMKPEHQLMQKWIMGSMIVFSGVITVNFPAALFMHWLPSNGMTLSLNLLSKLGPMKKLLRLPPERKNMVPWTWTPAQNLVVPKKSATTQAPNESPKSSTTSSKSSASSSKSSASSSTQKKK